MPRRVRCAHRPFGVSSTGFPRVREWREDVTGVDIPARAVATARKRCAQRTLRGHAHPQGLDEIFVQAAEGFLFFVQAGHLGFEVGLLDVRVI